MRLLAHGVVGGGVVGIGGGVVNYCATFIHGWRSVRHEQFQPTTPLPDGFVFTIRCQICGDYMSLGEANDRIPREEVRLAEVSRGR